MYHRIIPINETTPGLQAGMYVKPESFDMHLYYLKKYFRVIPFPEIITPSNNKAHKYTNTNKPLCIITFDDGWYDFYKYAYQILKAWKMPATVFLPTKYIGTGEQFWTDRLTSLIVQNQQNEYTNHLEKLEINGNLDVVEKIDRLVGTIDSISERAISFLKNYSDDDINVILDKLEIMWGLEQNVTDRAFLNWKEVGEMMESGFVNFGSHTNNHKMLTYLDNNEIVDELVQSRNKLIMEKVVISSFIPFSYPNGNFDERAIHLVKEAGYHAAVTTINGWNSYNSSLFDLKRVSIHEDMSSTKGMFGSKISKLL